MSWLGDSCDPTPGDDRRTAVKSSGCGGTGYPPALALRCTAAVAGVLGAAVTDPAADSTTGLSSGPWSGTAGSMWRSPTNPTTGRSTWASGSSAVGAAGSAARWIASPWSVDCVGDGTDVIGSEPDTSHAM